MSPQHDVTGAETTDGGQPGMAGEPASSAEAERLADATSRQQDTSGWSGRAIGPLSGMLPGGAVDLTADEVPVEQPTSSVLAGDHELASEAPTAEADAGKHELPAAVVVPTPAGDASASDSADRAVPDGHEPESVPATDDAQPDDASPAAQSPALTTDDRWHAVLVGFVDDPHGSVETAKALIDEDIAAHIALLVRRREAMHAAWQSDEEADTEALRVALVSYRDLRMRLSDVSSSQARPDGNQARAGAGRAGSPQVAQPR